MAEYLFSVPGYRHHERASTAGIIYDNGTGPFFLYFVDAYDRPIYLPREVNRRVDPFIACYSSKGLVAFRHVETNNYYIGNPFIMRAVRRYVAIPAPPRQHDPQTTQVVLAVDLADHPPAYYLVCAVQVGVGSTIKKYIFDVYSSLHGGWRSCPDFNLLDREIVPNTGVSCGRYAYWLTRFPSSVLRFDAFDPRVGFFPVPLERIYNTRLQLGIVEGSPAIVVVDGAFPRVELHLLRDNGYPRPLAILNLRLREGVMNGNDEPRLFRDGTGEVCLLCRDLPRAVRFNSFKMEVFLLVDGWVVLWENSTIDNKVRRAILFEGNVSGLMAADGFAHVFSTTLPGEFSRRVLDESASSS